MEQSTKIRTDLLTWYDRHKRNLFWREHPTPYYVWLSEIMLQQTRVEAVEHYFENFIKEVPDMISLSAIEEDKLLKLWEGLGYYNRAKNLKKAAEIMVQKYHGEVPDNYDELVTLPGIGSYTAGAILSISYHQNYPAVDGNVLRVISRLEGKKVDITKREVKKEIEKKTRRLVVERSGDVNQALMDLGATICLPNGLPNCENCPLQSYCQAYKKGTMLEIPLKKTKTEKKQEERTVLLFLYQNKVLLKKREEKGLLSSMYEFPNILGKLSTKEVETYLKEQKIAYRTIQKLASTKHIFTHLTWNLHGYMIELTKKGNGLYVTKEDLDRTYSIPTAFKTYKEELKKYMGKKHK